MAWRIPFDELAFDPLPHAGEARLGRLLAEREISIVLEENLADERMGYAKSSRDGFPVVGVEFAHVETARLTNRANGADAAMGLQIVRDQFLLRQGVESCQHLAQEGLSALAANRARDGAPPADQTPVVVKIVAVARPTHAAL